MLTVYNRFLEAVNKKIQLFQTQVMISGGCTPVFMTATDEGYEERPVDLEEMGNDMIAQMMRSACENPKVQHAALIMDAYTLVVENKDLEKLSESISKEEGTREALTAFLYSPGKTSLRRIIHCETKTGSGVWFGDMGWEEIPTSLVGRFSNPFRPLTI